MPVFIIGRTPVPLGIISGLNCYIAVSFEGYNQCAVYKFVDTNFISILFTAVVCTVNVA